MTARWPRRLPPPAQVVYAARRPVRLVHGLSVQFSIYLSISISRYENLLAAPAEAAGDDGRFDDAEEDAEADEDKETGQAR